MSSANFGVILLVDDNPTNLDVLVECFSAYGFDLSIALDGETALKQCELVHPDLILLDIMMPGLDGFETCQRLKERDHTKDIPVIFMTALSDQVSTVKGFSYGAVDYVTKPLQLEEVLARVTTHLKIRRLQKQLEETVSTLRQEVAERKKAEDALCEAMVQTEIANERMRKDLVAAARVQQALLPEALPPIAGASFAWVYRPCAELGGDSLNIFKLDDRHVGMYVLDVSGHGVQAALLSVTLSRVLIPRRDPACLMIRPAMEDTKLMVVSPAEVATRLNRMFPMTEETQQYFTLLYGILDLKERTFHYVCAGHPPPILWSTETPPTLCRAPSLPIGLFEEEQYETATVNLAPGSRIFLYSDGVVEAMNEDRHIFSEARLSAAIEGSGAETLQASVETIVHKVYDWAGSDQVHDDVSILAFELPSTSKS